MMQTAHWTDAHRLLHDVLHGRIERPPKPEPPRVSRNSTDRAQRVYNVLHEQPMTTAMVAEFLGLPKKPVASTISDLVRDGHIRSIRETAAPPGGGFPAAVWGPTEGGL